MINERAQEVIERCIMEDEGGWIFTDRKDDSGGATYGGMTWRTFDGWQQKNTVERAAIISEKEFRRWAVHHPDAKQVLQNRIIQCYYDLFWLDCHLDEVPTFAQQMFFSACVNMGKKEATKCLQMAFNNTFTGDTQLVVDGWWGRNTEAALSTTVLDKDTDELRYWGPRFKLAFSDAVMERYIRIVQRNAREWREWSINRNMLPEPKQPHVLQSENLMGWFNRARKYRSM